MANDILQYKVLYDIIEKTALPVSSKNVSYNENFPVTFALGPDIGFDREIQDGTVEVRAAQSDSFLSRG
jgi:hypothetical protein